MPPFPVDPKKDTICDVIRRWADVQPDAPAFVAENTAALSYGPSRQKFTPFHMYGKDPISVHARSEVIQADIPT